MNKLNMENVTEIFNCFICLGNLKCAHMCPHCSKLCCYSCIQQWLVTSQQSQCPHCQRTLRLEDLVNCRWVENVSQKLDTLLQVEKNAKKDLCSTHDKEFSVFCWNCEKCICHQCAILSGIHSNHVFKSMEEACLHHVEEIREGLIHLRNKHSEVKGIVGEIEKAFERMKNAKDERVIETNHFISQMNSNLEKKLQQKLPILGRQKYFWSVKCSEIESILDSFEKELVTCSRSELLSTSKRITQSLSRVTQSVSEFKCYVTKFQDLNGDALEFPSEVIPPYENINFVLSNFSHLQLKAVPVYSPTLRTLGSAWRLKVFPVGKDNSNRKYLSVFLELTSVFTETSKYQYKVEMVNQVSENPSNSEVREFTSTFDVGKSRGFNRFYLLDKLAIDGYLKDDTLILKFGVRFSSYYEKSRVQEEFINQLQTKISVLGK